MESSGDPILTKPANERRYPIVRCYVAAKRRGYPAFALKQGECFGLQNSNYYKFGRGYECENGNGGSGVMNIYYINPGKYTGTVEMSDGSSCFSD